MTRPSLTGGAAAVAALACGCAVLALVAGTVPSATPPLHVSPDGRFAVQLVSDHAFGQVEWLRVVAAPGTPLAHTVFEQPGDMPLRFVRWAGPGTAELAYAVVPEGARAGLTLACGDQGCRLD